VRETPSSFDYLLKCSTTSLEGFELARLNRIANLRKELRDLVEEWVAAEVEARVSRWLLEARRTRKQAVLPFGDPVLPSPEPSRLLDTMFADTCSATPFPFSPAEAALVRPPDRFASRPASELRAVGSPRAGPNNPPNTAVASHALSRYTFSAHGAPSCLPVMRPRVASDTSAPADRIRRRESA
jgi:hypothetical protein